jgi:DNA-binding transcriptional ArsR family regulator
MTASRSHEGPGAPTLTPGVAEIRALAHPLRLRLMEIFAEGPRTTKQVADLIGEPPTRLYHHVAALERAGLLRLKETRQNRGTTEKWYEATNRSMGFSDVRPGSARGRKSKRESNARRALAMSVLTQSRQEMVSAMAIRGRERPMLGRALIVAPAAQLGKLRKRLFDIFKEIREEFEDEDQNADAGEVDRWALTITFAPVGPPNLLERKP